MPVANVRRLNDGAELRTGPGSTAIINMADGTSYRIGPNITVNMNDYTLTSEGERKVFDARFAKVKTDVYKLLGGQTRFKAQSGPFGTIAARG